MPLLGSAALLLSFDVTPGSVDDHDRWHTHEHLPERLAIPGFLRGTRWTASAGGPRYMVLYEVERLATLGSGPYLERLNAPSPWTRRVMPHYRGMRRGLCSVAGSFGGGQGGFAALVRFSPDPREGAGPTGWLLDEALPDAARAPGLVGAHLLRAEAPAAMTEEQRIRGADLGVDAAIVLTGYDPDAVSACASRLCGPDGLADRGARAVERTAYTFACSLARAERPA